MTSIEKISDTKYSQSKPFLTPKNTGYAASAAMALNCVRAFSKNKTVIKTHKPLGYISAALTALHIGLIEYYHHKYKKM